MKKIEIISEISKNTGIEKISVQKIIENFMESIKNSLIKGENVYLRGFGTFRVIKRKKKIGRIIRRNVAIVIPERYVPSFKPSKEFVKQVIKKVKKV